MKYRVRMVEFVGTEGFPQGYGMTWDSVVIDVADDEQIIDTKAGHRSGPGFDNLYPVVQVWLMSPEPERPLSCG
jgi:hypothetical protein